MFPSQTWQDAQRRTSGGKAEDEVREARGDMIFMIITLLSILVVISAIMVSFGSSPCYPQQKVTQSTKPFCLLQLGAAWLMGARFDLAFQELKKGDLRTPQSNLAHGEL